MPTSQATVSLAVATRPPRMMVSSLVMSVLLQKLQTSGATRRQPHCTDAPHWLLDGGIGAMRLRLIAPYDPR
jgi:hypothetical protein